MKLLIFLGSVRESTPPKPARLGERVAKACLQALQMQFSEHSVEIIDPLDYPQEAVFKPHFAYASGRAPKSLDELAQKISASDGYIMVSPEYNHSMSPALAHLLNHFGSSRFSFKPSCIVTYSAGQWGGMRAAVAMRTFLSELGCLPVSAMVHIPKAQDVYDEQGFVRDSDQQENWQNYLSRSFGQLIWWADACRTQRQTLDPFSLSSAFEHSPSERNAP